MRALHLILAAGVIALLSTPVRTQQPSAATVRAAAAGAPTSVLPGTRSAAFATIQGNALNAFNAVLPNAAVRLRDAERGRIVFEQRTDKSGLFTFQPVAPGAYVVELKDERGVVLAASDLITIGAGETATTIVQLPMRAAGAGLLSSHRMSSILAVLSSAGAAGVLATSSTTDVSAETPHAK
jgi:hypothetical protein